MKLSREKLEQITPDSSLKKHTKPAVRAAEALAAECREAPHGCVIVHLEDAECLELAVRGLALKAEDIEFDVGCARKAHDAASTARDGYRVDAMEANERAFNRAFLCIALVVLLIGTNAMWIDLSREDSTGTPEPPTPVESISASQGYPDIGPTLGSGWRPMLTGGWR